MNKKSFFLGLLAGIVLTVAGFFVTAWFSQSLEDFHPVEYLEQPESYEGKKKAYFKVFQVFKDAALASEASDRIGGEVLYTGNTVMILGENYYSDQVVTVKNPQRVGTYEYTTRGDRPMSVPVIDGEIE